MKEADFEAEKKLNKRKFFPTLLLCALAGVPTRNGSKSTSWSEKVLR